MYRDTSNDFEWQFGRPRNVNIPARSGSSGKSSHSLNTFKADDNSAILVEQGILLN